MRKKWFRPLFRRRLIVAMLLILQVLVMIYLVVSASHSAEWINAALTLISFCVVIYVVSRDSNTDYKMSWIIQILAFPIFGGLFYLVFNFQRSTKKMEERQKEVESKTRELFLLAGDRYEKALAIAPECRPQLFYLQNYAGFPVYQKTQTFYLTPGEAMFEALKTELRKAEHYIFLEFFIIEEGLMWDSILEILKERAAAGVEVRLIYDDMGCFFLLPKDYPEQLAACGIRCTVFNPFRPVLSVLQNNRDHRKIVAIDGKVAFTGGINLADEYINAIEKYGHWKDAAIMLKGEAAWSFSLMFLQMWNTCNTGQEEEYLRYYPWQEQECTEADDGLVQPYCDSPMDRENVGEQVYLQIINNAKDYVYINTPYLVIDELLVSALSQAAKSGVDVRIVTPYRWDKKLVHMTTRSYYRQLIAAGVRIYEYSKGFIHSKTFVADDKVATVGTTNLDFRSLYLHFECGTWLYGSRAVWQVKEDFLATLDSCHEIQPKDCCNSFLMQLVQDVLRLFAPLM